MGDAGVHGADVCLWVYRFICNAENIVGVIIRKTSIACEIYVSGVHKRKMLQGGFLPDHLARVAALAPCRQLLLRRSTHRSVRHEDCPLAWFPDALARTNRVASKAAARDPRLRHRRWLGFGPPPHAAYYKLQPTARFIRQQMLGLGMLPYKERHVKVTTCGDLYKNGVDVLCFNWPDFGFTLETGYWWHSCDEKTRLVVDFLKKLKINKIDVLVSHSTGSSPALQMAAEEPSIDVKSLALLTPITTRLFRSSRNPLLFNSALRWATKSRRGARFMILFFKGVMMLSMDRTMGRPYDVLFAYHSSAGYNEHRVEQQLATIRRRKMPTLVVVGHDDGLLSMKDNRKLLRRLGCASEGVSLYDTDGNLLRSGSCDDVVKAIELEDGSHYGFALYPDICNKALLELINRVQEQGAAHVANGPALQRGSLCIRATPPDQTTFWPGLHARALRAVICSAEGIGGVIIGRHRFPAKSTRVEHRRKMLHQGSLPSRLVPVALLASRQQLLLQRYTTHHAASLLQGSPTAWLRVALAKTEGLVSRAAARDPRFRHRRCAHNAVASAPTAKSTRQLLRDPPPLPYKETEHRDHYVR
ncbi:hypothetical protein MTO96_048211 [Rhipicephalus appendiculatus]